MVWGAVISAAGSLLGGALSSRSASNTADDQMALTRDQMQLQREFAQQGIRWRVEDAKAAGIHPLYALGASIPSFSPVSYIPGDTGYGIGQGLSEAASHIGRSVDATRTPQEQVDSRLGELALTRAELENDLLRSQIAKLNQSPTVGLPAGGNNQAIPGQPDIERMGLIVSPAKQHVVEKPQEIVVASPFNSSQEPHPITDVGFVQTPTGLAPVPSKDAKDRIEDQIIPEAMWALRNHLIPTLGASDNQPPKSMLPEGASSWRWEVTKQEWQPVFHRPSSKPGYEEFWPRGGDQRTWSGRPYLGRSRIGSYW